MALPALQQLDVMGALGAGQTNALRAMQMQQFAQEAERKNQLESLMRNVDWSQPEEAFKQIGKYLEPTQALAFAQAIQKQQRDKQVMDIVNGAMGGNARAAMGAEGRGPTVTAATAGRIDPSMLPRLATLGDSGKAAADMIQKMLVPHNTPEGGMSRDMFGNITERPKIGEGLMGTGYDPSGRLQGVQPIPGYLAGLGGIEDTKQAAAARYKIENLPVPGMPGSTEPVSVLDFIRGQGAAPPVAARPPAAGALASPAAAPGAVVVPPAVQASRDATRLAILEDELSKNPTDTALQAEIARARGATRRTQTPGEKKADEIAAEAAAKRTAGMSGLGFIIDEARDRLKGKGPKVAGIDTAVSLPTASGLGSVVDSVSSFFGITPSGAEAADKLAAIGGALVARMPRMEGPQSDFDVKNYKEMAGKIGDSTLPISRRLAALDEVERLWRKYDKEAPTATTTAAKPGPTMRRYNPAKGVIE